VNAMKVSFTFVVALLVSIWDAQAQPTVSVGTGQSASPLAFVDSKSKNVEGVMPELIKAIAKDAGFEIQFVPMESNAALMDALASKKIDLTATSLGATEERKKTMLFSDVVLNYGDALLVQKSDSRNYASAADLKGLLIGVTPGSANEAVARNAGAVVKVITGIPNVLQALDRGELQGAIINGPSAMYLAKQGDLPSNVRLVKSYKAAQMIPGAFGTRPSETELITKINSSLSKLKSDGTVNRVLAKWGLD
jgi:polar amino acid transport system substrate-binding protein